MAPETFPSAAALIDRWMDGSLDGTEALPGCFLISYESDGTGEPLAKLAPLDGTADPAAAGLSGLLDRIKVEGERALADRKPRRLVNDDASLLLLPLGGKAVLLHVSTAP